MNEIKKFIKELKRVRWPSGREATKTFWFSVLFVTIASLFLFGVSLGLTWLWGTLGIGV